MPANAQTVWRATAVKDDIMSDLLDLAIEAHGGLERWREIERVRASFSTTGLLWAIKGHPSGLPAITMDMSAKRPEVRTTNFKAANQVATFEAERVTIENESGAVLGDLRQPRASFAGHELMTQINDLQLAYFASYAFWNYFTTPFLFTRDGFELREMDKYEENGEIWRRLFVTFPSDVPTHCPSQVFYFSKDGLLQRLDYMTDILGGMAAHYCFDHKDFDGIKVPTLRRVVRRTPEKSMLTDPTAVLVQISDVQFS
ncbi:hypothetical protein N185_16030 [Sinorhizobium sp. GW3]|nr:hypothetical protein N185_16030 [Sinorhizobium sp. GW3]